MNQPGKKYTIKNLPQFEGSQLIRITTYGIRLNGKHGVKSVYIDRYTYEELQQQHENGMKHEGTTCINYEFENERED